MFKKLESELVLSFDLKTNGPLYIKSSDDNSLNPSALDGTYMTTYRAGQIEPFIPGTSLKGVFRCRAERIIKDACDIVANKPCLIEKNEKITTGTDRYKRSCPVCRLFGSKVLGSRIFFSDFFVKGKYSVGQRTCTKIDRITGASKRSALYDIEYIEDATFQGKIEMQNFEPYQLNLIMNLLADMNKGFITIGGLSSKGFGSLFADNLKLSVLYYGKKAKLDGYEYKGYYQQKDVEGFDNIMSLVKDKDFSKVVKGGEIDGEAI